MRKLHYLVAALVAIAMLAVPAVASARDRDHDRLPDKWERKHHLSTKHKSARKDPDRDGLINLDEFRLHTDPRDADTDNDGVEDGDEDRDRDGVDNDNEAREHTSPLRRDTDRDGVRDAREDRDDDGLNNGAEDVTGNDPIDDDSDDDGVEDGAEQAGTIASFDPTTGVLVIDVAGGGQVSGRVTAATEIKCETEDEAEDRSGPSASSSESGPGHDGDGSDSSGPGSGGEDNSGPGSGDDEPDNAPGAADEACPGGTAALVPGARVHEAELELTSAGAVWEEIELIR